MVSTGRGNQVAPDINHHPLLDTRSVNTFYRYSILQLQYFHTSTNCWQCLISGATWFPLPVETITDLQPFNNFYGLLQPADDRLPHNFLDICSKLSPTITLKHSAYIRTAPKTTRLPSIKTALHRRVDLLKIPLDILYLISDQYLYPPALSSLSRNVMS